MDLDLIMIPASDHFFPLIKLANLYSHVDALNFSHCFLCSYVHAIDNEQFSYSDLQWNCSQFGDIYQEDYFMRILKDDVDIVKELPPHLKSLDIEAVGSLVCCLLSFDMALEAGLHFSGKSKTSNLAFLFLLTSKTDY